MPRRLCTVLALSFAFSAQARAEQFLVAIDGRVAAGIGHRLDLEIPNKSLALEAAITGRIGLHPYEKNEWVLTLMPELGYQGLVIDGAEDHGFISGLGIGVTFDKDIVFGIVPGLSYGSYAGADTRDERLGFRINAVIELIHFVGFQGGYQVAPLGDGRLMQEFRATASLNAYGIIAVLMIWGSR